MSLECEVPPDGAKARWERLRALQGVKAAHAPLPFAGRLVTVLCPIVQPGGGFNEHVFDVRQRRDLAFRRRIAAQLIGDDLARDWAGT